MATPITVLDSANISVTDNQYIVSITGSIVNQDDISYLLTANYSVTGSLISVTANGGTVGFGYGIAIPPTWSVSHPIYYPSSSTAGFPSSVGGARVYDFSFFLNGIRIDDSQVITFSTGLTPNESTASFNLGFPLRDYDVISGQGKFKVQQL